MSAGDFAQPEEKHKEILCPQGSLLGFIEKESSSHEHPIPGDQVTPSNPSEAFPSNASDTSQPVKIYPLLFEQAIRKKLGGAIRVWAIARSLDTDGRGTIPKSTLFHYLGSLGVNKRTLDRWVGAALKTSLLVPYKRTYSGERGFRIPSVLKTSELLGIDNVGKFPVSVPVEALVQKGYRGYIWGGILKAHEGRPISRRRLKAKTSVPARTQRHREKGIAVDIIHNIAVTDISADHLDGIREFTGRIAFQFNQRGKRPVVALRLPDIRVVSEEQLKTLKSGKNRHINTTLRPEKPLSVQNADWSLWGLVPSDSTDVLSPPTRLFYEDARRARSATRRIIRCDDAQSVEEVFVLVSVSDDNTRKSKKRYNLWRSMPV